MSTYIASIQAGGSDFPVPFDNHQWAIVAGYQAPIQSWLVPQEVATGVLAALGSGQGTGREVTLTLGDPDAPIIVERVYVIGTAPADNPQRAYLLFSDVRFYLTRIWTVLDVNVRRRLGEVRLVGNVRVVEQGLADTVAYAPWSINAQKAFTWQDQSNQTLTYLGTPRHGRPAILWQNDGLSLNIAPQVVQETTTDSDGSMALARAIEALPGAGIYPDLKGTLHVYDARPGAEKALVQALPKALWRHGNLQFVDLSGIRPNLWRVYVDYALEVRFNYRTSSGYTLALTDLQNVLQVTDLLLTIPAGPWGPERTVGQGTWITLTEAYAAWGGKAYPFLKLPTLTDDIVADHWFGDQLQQYCMGGNVTTHDPVWSMRIQELLRCWRTYFRVNPAFWDKVRHFWNVRVAVWDPTTGTRAPSPVYSNFHYMQLDGFTGAAVDIFGTNVLTSYPESNKLADGQPSGFQVDIVDEELMIIMIDRNIGKFPGHARLAPSPTIDGVTLSGTTPGFNEAVYQKLVHIGFTSAPSQPDPKTDWALAIIMTCSPASPNDERRLYEIQVTLTDALAALGGLEDTPVCHAPDQELRSHLAEARVGWDDDVATSKAILATFGGSDTGAIGEEDPVRTLVPINLNRELQPLGAALAATDLVQKLDHYEGILSVPMSGDVVPIGSITQVVHGVTKNRATSTVHATGPSHNFDATEFLRGTARDYLLKQIQKAR